ncbi:MAG: metal-dependent transcriptional regulator [Candidatus Hydrogenedentes bacterium]|nr:metal-dependent transcriptional regulator [Candidatus Hydrogenedentota bacterium]
MPATKLSASLEDYLEAIFWLVRDHKVARSKDIAARLKVSKASVTGALRQLTAGGLVNYDPYSYVTLTQAGERVARGVVKRHRVLAEFLRRVLGINSIVADENACRIEHTVDDVVVARMLAFLAFLDSEKPDIKGWLATIPNGRGKEGVKQ